MSTTSKKPKQPPVRNLMGLEIRRIREQRGWSQADFARKLQLAGWDVERTVLTKIELRRRCITDYELVQMAKTLDVSLDELIPKQPGVRAFFS